MLMIVDADARLTVALVWRILQLSWCDECLVLGGTTATRTLGKRLEESVGRREKAL
jgi:hypothetical protein